MPCNEDWLVSKEELLPLIDIFQDMFEGRIASDVVLSSALVIGNMIADAASMNQKHKRAWMNEAVQFHTEISEFLAEVISARADVRYPETEH